MKEFADNNFKSDENERKSSKQVENTVEKGEIACYEQFLLFPQCFHKACFPGVSKGVIVWEWVKNRESLVYLFTIQSQNLMTLTQISFENTVHIFGIIQLVVCKYFQFEEVQYFVVWYRLNPLLHGYSF